MAESLLGSAGEPAEPAGTQVTTPVANEGQGNPTPNTTGNTEEIPQWHYQFSKKALENELAGKLGDYKNATDVAVRGVLAIDELAKLKEQAIIPPGEGATAEDIQAFRQKLGVPESSDNYKFDEEKISGLAEEKGLLESYKNLALEANLTNDQAQKVASFFAQGNKDAKAEITKFAEERRTESEKVLKDAWKDDYPKNLKQVSRLIKEHGGEGFLKTLEASGYANEASFILPMYEISKKITDPAFDDSGSQASKNTDPNKLSFPNTTYPHLVKA